LGCVKVTDQPMLAGRFVVVGDVGDRQLSILVDVLLDPQTHEESPS
jgi:hypothetical protein